MSKRKIPVNKEKAKEIKKLLWKAKNNVERKRIAIMVQYLSGSSMDKIVNSMMVSKTTVSRTVKRYEQDESNFFDTNYQWRIESVSMRELAEQAKKYISSEENLDINGLKRKLEKENGRSYEYKNIHWLVRKKLWYNYQKPFVTNEKQSPHAKEMAEWRLRKAIYEVALEEREIDVECVKNKKNKILRK